MRKPTRQTELAKLEAAHRGRSAKFSYGELRAAILREGGIRANRDYRASEIPRGLYNRNGLAPDEMADTLQIHGFHFDGDVDLFAEIGARQDELQTAREGGRKRKNPSMVCVGNCRDPHGRFQVCPHGA